MFGLVAQGEGPPAIVGVIYLAVAIVMLVAMWKVLAKAGQPGWACIVPIFNIYIMLKVADKPIWWILLFFVPIANIVVAFLMMIGIAEKFGKGAGFGVGLTLLGFIFFPILAFTDATYQG